MLKFQQKVVSTIETGTKTPGRVTQRDIAKAAGVSHVTVSNVLHSPHGARISPEIRLEILRIARQMGYEPRGATTHSIAVVIEPSSLATDILTQTIATADEVLRLHGFRLSVITLGAENLNTAPDLLNKKTVDGAIFTEGFGQKSYGLHALRVPWVLLADTTDLDGTVDQIAPDTEVTASALTGRLLEQGHRRICIFGGEAGIGFTERMERGVQQAVEHAGLPASNAVIIRDDPSADIELALLGCVQGHAPCTAIVVGSPGAAMVALNRLQRRGIRVPDDVSIVSLTDSERLTALRPAITATTLAGREVVTLAIERLIARIERPDAPPERLSIAGHIIDRDSITPAVGGL